MMRKYEKIRTKFQSDYDGHPLSMVEVIPEEPRAVLQLVHGMSEYKERYLDFMEYMAGKGVACVIHDHRGHGQSVRAPKDLGYMYGGGAEAMIEDIRQVNSYIHRKWEGLPVILFGHSMGSLAVRYFMKKYDDRADMLVVCGSPSKNSALAIGKLLIAGEKKLFGERHPSKLMEALSFGGYVRKFPGEKGKSAWICSNPAVVKEYAESPLCGFTFSTDAYEAVFQLMEGVYSREGWQCANPAVPILFIGGGDDPCIGGPRKYAQALSYMRQAGYRDVKGKLYPGLRHEILNETEKEKVYRDVYVYIKKKLF